MSDHRGLFEHASGTARREEHGYCTDDNARLLVVTSREPDTGIAHRLSRLALQFVCSAQVADGSCRNRMSAEGRWLDVPGTDDCWGRGLHGLGVASAGVGFVSMTPVRSVQDDEAFKGYASKFTSDVDVCTQAKNDPSAAAQDVASKCSKAKTFEVVQAVTFPLAAVASGVGIYLLATSDWSGRKSAPKQPQTGFSVTPLVGPQAGKLDVTYRW